jgi:hypothetical protein
MRTAQPEPIELLPDADERKRDESVVDAPARRVALEVSVLRLAEAGLRPSRPKGAINRKRVQRLMRVMGIEAVYPKPRERKRDIRLKGQDGEFLCERFNGVLYFCSFLG